jgi:5-methyltetrahydrofolate--homocysteine methyltransferase
MVFLRGQNDVSRENAEVEEDMADLKLLHDAVLNGKRKDAEALTQKALDEGAEAIAILEKALIPAMNTVGERFKAGEYFVPEMLVAAKAMKTCMEMLRSRLKAKDYKPLGRVVIGTVRGDLHDIGKNLVKMMLEGAGFEVVDLGVDVSPEKFVEAARQNQAQVVAMSALLTTTMLAMPDTVKALESAGMRKDVKVIVGGAAATDAFAKEIKADGYGADAYSAVELAKSLIGKK